MKPERRDALDAQLRMLNKSVEDAVAARRAWMDAHMNAYARYALGEELFDRATGRLLGRVSGYYRLHRGDDRFDNTMHVSYRYEIAGLAACYGNTSSRQGSERSVCNAEEMTNELRRRLSAMENPLGTEMEP